jgi:hypothetical protein
MTKLSLAQRKVLEVMAEGGTLSRTRLGSSSWLHWNYAPGAGKKPERTTIRILEEAGLIEVKRASHLTRTWSITDKGREALK